MFTGIHGVFEPEWRSNRLVPGRNQRLKLALVGLEADYRASITPATENSEEPSGITVRIGGATYAGFEARW